MLKGDKFVVGPTTILLMKFGRNSDVNIILNQQQSLCDQSTDYSHQQICVTNNFHLILVFWRNLSGKDGEWLGSRLYIFYYKIFITTIPGLLLYEPNYVLQRLKGNLSWHCRGLQRIYILKAEQ